MTDSFVKPDVRTFLDSLRANPRPLFTAEMLAYIRTLPPETMAALDLPVGDIAVQRDMLVPGPAGDIAVRLYDTTLDRAPGPVLVFFHGGGFVVGSIDTHASLAAEIARQVDVPVITVEYRLAPENPWPAAPDDAEAAVRWIADNGSAFGGTFTSMVLCGDSAGGTLALVTSLALRDNPASLPVQLQFALYPATQPRERYPSKDAYSDGYGLESANLDLYEEHYASDPGHWRASPLLADQAGLPPTFIVTAALDPLRDEARAYAAKTIQAGVDTTYREIRGTIHGFATYRLGIESARSDLAGVLDSVRELIEREPATHRHNSGFQRY